AQPARRVDLRLHRDALGRLGRGLRRSPRAARGRAPPSSPRAGGRARTRAARAAVAWRMPRTAAALACREDRLDRLATRLPADALAAGLDGVGCAIVPDPDGPGRPGQIERAVEGAGMRTPAVLGPTGTAGSLAASWSFARATLRAV